jgi:predicted permease
MPSSSTPGDWHAYVRSRLPALDIPPERELEIVDELALQLEAAYDAAIARGLERDAALRSAESEIPDWRALAASLTHIERPVFSPSPATTPHGGPMRGFVRDLFTSAASLIRTPGFTALAVVTLAVGIGLGTAAFVLIHGVLIAPLPYASPDRLVLVHASVPPENRDTTQLAFPDTADLAASGAFSSFATVVVFTGTTTSVDPPARVEGWFVSPGAFEVLGVRPALGRTISLRDGEPGQPAVVMLGHGYWTRMGSPPDIVGTTLILDEVPRTIIGVAGRDFRFDLLPTAGDVFLPITREMGSIVTLRAVRAFRAIGRLADGVTLAGANAAVATVGQRLQQAYPTTNQGRNFSVQPLADDIVAGIRGPLLLVATLVALVLLIVGVNLSSLLLARAVSRARETSIRLALGATKWRLARESFAEALMLSLAGAAVGYAIATALVAGLRAAPGVTLPRLAEVSVSTTTAVALAVLSLPLAAALMLVAQASSRRLHAMSSLRTGHETSDRRTGFVRGALVAGQTSLAFVLLASALLLAVSLRAVLAMPLGIDTTSVVTMRLLVPATRYASREDTTGFYRQVLESLRGRSEITGAGLVSALPLELGSGSTLTIAGQEQTPEAMRPTIRWNWSSEGYFGAVGVPILRGRDFTAADLTRPGHVTIINETLARMYFPNEDPIGKRVYFGPIPAGGVNDWHEIIGVAGDIRTRIEEAPSPVAFDLFGQHWSRSVAITVRSSASALHVSGVVRGVIAERDPRLALFAVRTADELVSIAVATRRAILALVAGFAVVGFIVAFVGLYGTVAYMVAARTREMSVRVALGATAIDIGTLVFGYGLRLVGAGLAIGVVGALALRSVIESQLVGVGATNVGVLAAAAFGLALAAAAACALPARRALKTDPVATLRCD